MLREEDYKEPCCPLERPTAVHPIPTGRVLEKLDEYLSRNDFSAAERHLAYWLAEAEHDEKGRLTVLNEQIGLYRKLEREEEALRAIAAALALANKRYPESVTAATTFLNAATAYKAFHRENEARPLYRRAREIYEALLSPEDERLGGLYNNMATAEEDFSKAEELYQKALAVMSKQEHGEAECAVTYCNLADLAASRFSEESEEKIEAYLKKAKELLDTETLPRDGAYAYICEKCASAFGYHGFFVWEAELKKRAEEIYERD